MEHFEKGIKTPCLNWKNPKKGDKPYLTWLITLVENHLQDFVNFCSLLRPLL